MKNIEEYLKEYIVESTVEEDEVLEPFFWWNIVLQNEAEIAKERGLYNGFSEEFNQVLLTKVSKVRTISDVEKMIKKYHSEVDQKMMEHDIAVVDKMRSDYREHLAQFVGDDNDKLGEIVGVEDFEEHLINGFPYELIIKEIY